jgi:hypothetical protein
MATAKYIRDLEGTSYTTADVPQLLVDALNDRFRDVNAIRENGGMYVRQNEDEVTIYGVIREDGDRWAFYLAGHPHDPYMFGDTKAEIDTAAMQIEQWVTS